MSFAARRIAFRADASLQIGSGHVMRCLTLADLLRSQGADCLFICRAHPGHLGDLISARGHRIHLLEPPQPTEDTQGQPTGTAHAAWLGTSLARDAAESRSALIMDFAEEGPCDWLVVDHYALDQNWETALRPLCRYLMVIDDLADRPHDCDLLLDPGLGRKVEDYAEFVPRGNMTLVGPQYALLRPEFAAQRATSIERRDQPQLRRLLITMGGVDRDDATGTVLDALANSDLPADLEITVVMGPKAPWLERIRTRAAIMPRPTRVLAGVTDMARLMTESDLAIGAAGSTAWERCCLGLPTIQIVLAENQSAIGRALELASAALSVDLGLVSQTLPALLGNNAEIEGLMMQSAFAFDITDGLGAERIASYMRRKSV